MAEVNLLQYYPQSKRNIDDRVEQVDAKVREISMQFGKDYFDGERTYGYGGYNYHSRFWTDTVKHIKEHYRLPANARVLDVGCAKGFMMHDFKLLMPDMDISGVDISEYAIENAIDDMKPCVQVANARDLPFDDNYFDLVLAINVVHNLPREQCIRALQEIQRVTRLDSFIIVDAWQTEEERVRLQNWVLTAQTYMHVDNWLELFSQAGYTGDYYWFTA
jgi:ubiquinone/menaquinone biosynthesis C-methylase UbiE